LLTRYITRDPRNQNGKCPTVCQQSPPSNEQVGRDAGLRMTPIERRLETADLLEHTLIAK
jgi:hypothetical protein